MAVNMIDLTTKRHGQGVVWVNSSHADCRYVREAERSAKTIRRFVHQSEFVLVSDQVHDNLDPVFDFQTVGDFHVPPCLTPKIHYHGQMVTKLAVLKQMTWPKNLYLGSDIAALQPGVQGIFRLLDHFDIIVAHAPTRIYSRGERDDWLLALPDCFPEMNCDLIAYRRSDAVGDFLAEWEHTYVTNAIDHPHDQGAFRYLVLNSNLRLYILPPEYNHRGFTYAAEAIIVQRREAIHDYAAHYPHIAELYRDS